MHSGAEEKTLVIGFHVYDEYLIKIINNKTISVVKNGSEKSIEIKEAPSLKMSKEKPLFSSKPRDDYPYIKTYIAEREKGVIIIVYSSENLSAIAIVDLEKNTCLASEQIPYSNIDGLYALPPDDSSKNVFVIENGFNRDVFSYQNQSVIHCPDRTFVCNWLGVGVSRLVNENQLLVRSHYACVKLLNSDMQASGQELALGQGVLYPQICSRFFPVSKSYTACIIKYRVSFDKVAARFHIFSHDFKKHKHINDLKSIVDKSGYFDKNFKHRFNYVRHVLFNEQHVAIVCGKEHENISVSVFDLHADGKKIKEYILSDSEYLFSDSVNDKLITCDKLGKITVYKPLPMPERVKIKVQVKTTLINKMPKEVIKIITDYHGSFFENNINQKNSSIKKPEPKNKKILTATFIKKASLK